MSVKSVKWMVAGSKQLECTLWSKFISQCLFLKLTLIFNFLYFKNNNEL